MTQNYSERTLGIISKFDVMMVESMQQQSLDRKKKEKMTRRIGRRLRLTDSKPKSAIMKCRHHREYSFLRKAFSIALEKGHSVRSVLHAASKAPLRSESILKRSSLLKFLSRCSASKTRRLAKEMGMFDHRSNFLSMLPRKEAFAVVIEQLRFRAGGGKNPWELTASSEGSIGERIDESDSDSEVSRSFLEEESDDGDSIVGRIATREWDPLRMTLDDL